MRPMDHQLQPGGLRRRRLPAIKAVPWRLLRLTVLGRLGQEPSPLSTFLPRGGGLAPPFRRGEMARSSHTEPMLQPGGAWKSDPGGVAWKKPPRSMSPERRVGFG